MALEILTNTGSDSGLVPSLTELALSCEILWHSFQGNVYLITQDINSQVVFEMYTFKISATSPRDNGLNSPTL